MGGTRGQRRTARAALLLAGTILTAGPLGAQGAAQTTPPPAGTVPAAVPATSGTIRSIAVIGNQRLEADTIRSYIRLRVGQGYTQADLDEALKDLAATELFEDFQIEDKDGALIVNVKENPVINRVLLEGNKRLKEDKIRPEIKLAPRQIYTRSKVRADVARIIELYKRQGRFAAKVDPKLVRLDQNRVDIVFEVEEGPKSKVREINIIGNEKFSDRELAGELYTRTTQGLTAFLSSNTSYDPDRLVADQQKLRLFYLTNGYADFRVVSAVAELTSDQQDFIITFVVEEGERYKFGEVGVETELRDFDKDSLSKLLPMKAGDWYNIKQLEDTVNSLSETAGLFGYAFADVNPQIKRNPETRTMDVTFQVGETPRVYVERIDVNGNTLTQDKVVRREFRLNEGDAFNTVAIKRSEARINSLGFFQEKFEVTQKEGSAPDRIILEANVEEKATGELALQAGFSSIENFIFSGSIRQNNFRGMGQQLSASINYSSYSKSAELGFSEPYLLDKPISLGGRVYRRDLNSFNFVNNDRRTTFGQVTTGGDLSVGAALTEYVSLLGRYTLNFDDVTLDRNLFFFGDSCDPLIAGRYLCDAIGKRTTSALGLTAAYDDRDNRIRPTRGQALALTVDGAGIGGDVKYARARLNSSKHWSLGSGFIFNASLEGGYIRGLGGSVTASGDTVRLTDRFLLGEGQLRGFDIRGVGPRVLRYRDINLTDPANPIVNTERRQALDDALGGNAYYLARAELEIPLGSGAKELGLRPSVFVDVGSLFGVRTPQLTTLANFRDPADGLVKSLCRDQATGTQSFALGTRETGFACPTGLTTVAPFEERFFGDSIAPRVSIGAGVNWVSPFGPFRIDFAYALKKAQGDDPKRFSFNVGTQF